IDVEPLATSVPLKLSMLVPVYAAKCVGKLLPVVSKVIGSLVGACQVNHTERPSGPLGSFGSLVAPNVFPETVPDSPFSAVAFAKLSWGGVGAQWRDRLPPA